MKPLCISLLTIGLFLSCSDPLNRNSVINNFLEKEITRTLSLCLQYSGSGNASSDPDPKQIDKDIHEIINSVNLFDGSTKTIERADKYFSDIETEIALKKRTLISLSTLSDKQEIITAAKLNELAILHRLLLLK